MDILSKLLWLTFSKKNVDLASQDLPHLRLVLHNFLHNSIPLLLGKNKN